MSLIELLLAYADTVRKCGRMVARKTILESCDVSLWKHIINSVNDRGELIGVLGERFQINKLESIITDVDELTENM